MYKTAASAAQLAKVHFVHAYSYTAAVAPSCASTIKFKFI